MSNVVIDGHLKDLGDGFRVRRLLPDLALRTVGPFVFFDHMGPVDLAPGRGMDVRPHPHIGLATVTWLFEGTIRHRDSLGTVLDIEPGAVNWMIAGRGIVHSERSPPEARAGVHRVHGIQTWVGLPLADQDMAPQFVHVPAKDVPRRRGGGADIAVIAGDAWDLRSPVPVRSRTLYLSVHLERDAVHGLPADHVERAVYCVSGRLALGDVVLEAGRMAALGGGEVALRALEGPAVAIVLGGDPLDIGPENSTAQPRHLRWNFVASERARIDVAAAAWQRQDATMFPPVPGETEFIPLPD